LKIILDQLDDWVETQSDRIAICDGETEVTFAHLGRWTDIVAAHIQSLNLDPARPVAYLGSQGLHLIIAYVASQKAGVPFLPINNQFPEPMIKEVFERSKSAICYTDRDRFKAAAFLPFHDLPLQSGNSTGAPAFQRPDVDDQKIALIQCSSGSTGLPKLIPYSRLAEQEYVRLHFEQLSITRDDVVAHMDLFWMESPLSALVRGARVHCMHPKDGGIVQISEQMIASKVSVLPVYPSLFRMFIDTQIELPDLRLVMLSGEAIKPIDLEAFDAMTRSGAELQNWYASMEATCTVYSHRNGVAISSQPMPAGKAVVPLKIHLEGEGGDVLPDGEIGEIVVTSHILPVEYLGDPERSARAFGTNDAGERTYHTGDYGYIDSQANLRYVARRDDQVKVSGFSVRLSVVEDELLSHPDVEDCGVIAVNGKRQTSRLHGFYVGEVTPQTLITYLSGALPSYMVPLSLVQVDTIPKTETGKTRRDALRKMAPSASQETCVPMTGQHAEIAKIWSQVLEHSDFTETDNFADVGGDSLGAMEMLMAVELSFKTRISIDQFILMGGTIRALSDALNTKDDARLRVLKAGRGKRTIYVTHVWDGGVSDYFDVASALDRDTKVIGITADYSGRSRAISIEEKAIEAVKHLPNEPTRILVGYSFGAPLAMEIARLTPETNTQLILIDPLSKQFRGLKTLRYWAARIEKRIGQKRPLGYERSAPQDYLYSPSPINVQRACVFQGADLPAYALPHWQALLGAHLDVFEHLSDHVAMMRAGGAMQIAAQIADWLDQDPAG
jgi:acyl-coenzyme A synthetase/AMP-(fatty) acid ligase/acyl carrier protein